LSETGGRLASACVSLIAVAGLILPGPVIMVASHGPRPRVVVQALCGCFRCPGRATGLPAAPSAWPGDGVGWKGGVGAASSGERLDRFRARWAPERGGLGRAGERSRCAPARNAFDARRISWPSGDASGTEGPHPARGGQGALFCFRLCCNSSPARQWRRRPPGSRWGPFPADAAAPLVAAELHRPPGSRWRW
jgi:hypothetical protein